MTMLCLDVGSSPSRRSRFWHFYSSKWPHRRVGTKFLSRLPLLILWTLVITVILYKFLLNSGNSKIDQGTIIDDRATPIALAAVGKDLFQDEVPTYEDQLLLAQSTISGQDEYNKIKDRQQDIIDAPTVMAKLLIDKSQLSTTKKPEVYLRQGKVFILIIQNNAHITGQLYHRSFGSSLQAMTGDHLQNGKSTLRLPNHIRLVIDILEAHRIDYTVGTTDTGLPETLLNDRSDQSSDDKRQRYSVIILDDFYNYAKLNHWMRDQLDRHCRANNIGVIAYINQQNSLTALSGSEDSLNELNYQSIHNQKNCATLNTSAECLVDYQLNDRSPILRILKSRPDFILPGPLLANLDNLPWISMSSNHITYEPLTWAHLKPRLTDDNVIENPIQVLSMFDKGLYDGVKRVIFGGANHFWLNRILLLDAIEHLSQGQVLSPLDRYVQVDIDDVFVAERGKRMNKSDVDALVVTQARIAGRIRGGFKFNLGFSGKYYKHGFESENMGDEQLVKRAQEFTWFCHTWSHSKAHLANDTQSIVVELRKNLNFARQHKLPIIGYSNSTQLNDEHGLKPPTYAVAPHHSGVYPIHEQLFEAWKSELNVQVTSTEEYPRLRPASGRRGFVYKSIKVLPRQTCGLYTHTVFRDKYPGGFGKLEANVMGGELFETILHNPVNIYMTHMSNYANDRLAPYTFEALLDFVQANTNLQLRYAPSKPFSPSPGPTSDSSSDAAAALPARTQQSSAEMDKRAGNNGAGLGPDYLARHYFNLYPGETEPLWTNPCSDKRHLAIWAPWKVQRYCRRLVPRLLIVGPQKTGTTALYTYLKLNPLFRSSRASPGDFEEVQFFNDKHYFEGVDWYFDRFEQETVADSAVNSSGSVSSSTSLDAEDEGPSELESDAQEDSFYYFDKSASYFDDPKAPLRARHLLPEARVLIMLIDPADRAYSWYQHSRAHGDPTALAYTFERIIMAPPEIFKESKKLALRNRCLQPGFYSQHLTRWLDHYPSRQVFIIDGQWFRYQPGAVMNKLQLMLRATQPLDYNKLLVYNRHKGFYCSRATVHEPVRCLGPGKGRKYPPMSERARAYLNRLYWPHNKQLVHLLSEIGQPLPLWLEEATSPAKRFRTS